MASAPFPVAGQAFFSDDFGFPRYVPVPHLHEGTDIFADFGTPIVASGPGVVAGMADSSVGGLAIWVAADDGTGLYYAHLLNFAPGVGIGMRVDSGTLLGSVGSTGDAAGGPPHLHFEVHPPTKDAKGRITLSGVDTLPTGFGATRTPAVDPKPFLDAWLLQAEQKAQALVDALIQRLSVVQRDLHFSRRLDQLIDPDSRPSPSDSVLSLFEPALGSLGIARDAIASAATLDGLGSASEKRSERARLAAVRAAVYAKDLRLSSLTAMPLLGYPTDQVASG
ncbi:MAG: M23 family metallopeptidase [Actinomycetota bacterium]|nr:M23 family metallopeptidase [Actinomycetota bacterium]